MWFYIKRLRNSRTKRRGYAYGLVRATFVLGLNIKVIKKGQICVS